MNVEEYFEIYTGGNDCIENWTPTSLKEFADAYHKMKKREENLVNNTVLDPVSKSFYSDDAIARLKTEYFEKGLKANK